MGKKNKIKLETGTVYQKEEGGTYYFRYQVNHERKCVSLKTQNQEEALKKAKELLPIVQATTAEVISAHVKVARNLARKSRPLALKDAWKIYAEHPDRAFPATRHEEISYETTFTEFIRHVGEETQVAAITPGIADQYAAYLKTTAISVSTHNRKILRLRKTLPHSRIIIPKTIRLHPRICAESHGKNKEIRCVVLHSQKNRKKQFSRFWTIRVSKS